MMQTQITEIVLRCSSGYVIGDSICAREPRHPHETLLPQFFLSWIVNKDKLTQSFVYWRSSSYEEIGAVKETERSYDVTE